MCHSSVLISAEVQNPLPPDGDSMRNIHLRMVRVAKCIYIVINSVLGLRRVILPSSETLTVQATMHGQVNGQSYKISLFQHQRMRNRLQEA